MYFLAQAGVVTAVNIAITPGSTPDHYRVVQVDGTEFIGAGSFTFLNDVCCLTVTASDTNIPPSVTWIIEDAASVRIGQADVQIVSYDPFVGGGGGGDPWLTHVPGAYAPGEAGNILGNLAGGSADALLDQVNGVETGITVRDTFKAMLAVLGGLLQTQGATAIYRNPSGTKNRVIVTLAAGGQRTSITFDFS